VNKEIYIDILRRLTDSVKWKCPEKLRTNIWFPIHDNAPAHRSVSLKDFIAKSNVTTLDYAPYSTDLDPTVTSTEISIEGTKLL